MTVRYVVTEASGDRVLTVADAVAVLSGVAGRRVTVAMATRQGHPFVSMSGFLTIVEHEAPPGAEDVPGVVEAGPVVELVLRTDGGDRVAAVVLDRATFVGGQVIDGGAFGPTLALQLGDVLVQVYEAMEVGGDGA